MAADDVDGATCRDEMASQEKPVRPTPSVAAPSVIVRGVSKSFGNVHALADIDLQIQPGTIYGLLGPSGAGKTTLVRVMAGLLRPDVGDVDILGQRLPDPEVLAHIGYVPQLPAVYDELSARQNVAFFAALQGLRDADAVDDVLALVGLADRADSPVHEYSGGMVRRVSLAIALVHRPRLLLLDEPTVGLDPVLRQAFWEHFRALADGGSTLVVTTHVMDEADRMDRLGLVRAGRLLVEGTPHDVRTTAGTDNLEAAFLALADDDEVMA